MLSLENVDNRPGGLLAQEFDENNCDRLRNESSGKKEFNEEFQL